jgi:hypothetical protein
MTSSVVLATAGYDHSIRFWEATSGICYRTLQYPDSQVSYVHLWVCQQGGVLWQQQELLPSRENKAAAGFSRVVSKHPAMAQLISARTGSV